MDTLSFAGAQWWDYIMLLVIAIGCLAYCAYTIVSLVSRERISFLHNVKWHGRFNTYNVYGICVEVRSIHRLRAVINKRDMVVVSVLGVLRDNSTWEELPFWMQAQIRNYVAKNSVATKTSLEIAHYLSVPPLNAV